MHERPVRRAPLPSVLGPQLAAGLGLVATILCTSTGCSQSASLQRETPNGGIATFSIEAEGDILSSDGRREALRLIDAKCPSGAKIMKEGELPKVSQAADRAWGPQIGTDKKWGIQFECK